MTTALPTQTEFSRIRVIKLAFSGRPIEAPLGLVYSTSPTSWIDLDGESWVVKGPDVNPVVAECVAYQLARAVGLVVPDFALAYREGEAHFFFASKKIDGIRDASPFLVPGSPSLVELSRIVIFDIWTANYDRNMGNLLVRRSPAGSVELVAIDFEKAVPLRGPYPLTATPQVAPSALWPSGDLGALLAGMPTDDEMLRRIERVRDNELSEAVAAVEQLLGAGYTWGESSVRTLIHRREHLRRFVREVWQ